MNARRALALAALVACCRREARPNDALPTARARKVAEGAIRVDGTLDEEAWRRAASTGAFVSPRTGAADPASRVQGEARFAWDERNLYVAVRVGDRAPYTPFTAVDDDPHLWEGASAVELMLQPGDHGDNRVYYEVQADAACAKWTTRFDDYNSPITEGPDGRRRFGHQEWSPAIECAARRSADGYVVELALPWRDVAGDRARTPPRAGDAWRANVYSFRDGQRDALAWSPLLGRGNFHFAPRFGRVVFDGP